MSPPGQSEFVALNARGYTKHLGNGTRYDPGQNASESARFDGLRRVQHVDCLMQQRSNILYLRFYLVHYKPGRQGLLTRASSAGYAVPSTVSDEWLSREVVFTRVKKQSRTQTCDTDENVASLGIFCTYREPTMARPASYFLTQTHVMIVPPYRDLVDQRDLVPNRHRTHHR
jgi:hypothetical protein